MSPEQNQEQPNTHWSSPVWWEAILTLGRCSTVIQKATSVAPMLQRVGTGYTNYRQPRPRTWSQIIKRQNRGHTYLATAHHRYGKCATFTPCVKKSVRKRRWVSRVNLYQTPFMVNSLNQSGILSTLTRSTRVLSLRDAAR